MAITIDADGFKPQDTSTGTAQAGENKIDFELDEGINRIQIAFQNTQNATFYFRLSNAVTTSADNYMYIAYHSRTNYNTNASDAVNQSGSSTTNINFFLTTFTPNSNAGNIWHRADITIISVPCNKKVVPSIWTESSYTYVGGGYEFIQYGGGKVFHRTSSTERPVYFQLFNSTGHNFNWKARRYTEAKIFQGT